MATLLLRVSLTVETVANYTYIKERLIEIGFSKKIKSADGIYYRLPNGNYIIDTNYTVKEILDKVISIVLKIDKTPQIVLTETADKGTRWYGLSVY